MAVDNVWGSSIACCKISQDELFLGYFEVTFSPEICGFVEELKNQIRKNLCEATS